MECFDVRCPICKTLNRHVYLEETHGWMECEHCKQVVMPLNVPGYSPMKKVPLYTFEQLSAAHRSGRL